MKKAGLGLFLVFGLLAAPVSAGVSAIQDEDTIKYDSFGPLGGKKVLNDDYWIAVRFSADSLPFTLAEIQLRLDNSFSVPAGNCTLYVTSDDGFGRPVFPVPAGKYESTAVVIPSVPNVLFTWALSDTVRISKNEKFWVLVGPVPGGADTLSLGSGWWGVRDTAAAVGRSFISTNNRATWDSLTAGNWVVRAIGQLAQGFNVVINELMFRPDTFSTDPERNHQWVELYNPGPEQAGDLVRHTLTNRPMDKTLSLPTFDFPAGSYLVVHFSQGTSDFDFSDGRGDYYAGNQTFLDYRSDACALFSSDTATGSSLQIRDILPWNAGEGTLGFSFQAQGAEDSALNAGIMGNFFGGDFLGRFVDNEFKVGPLLFATHGMSVGRNDLSDDNPGDVSSDFEFHGGRNAVGPTMGERNQTAPMRAGLAGSDPPVQPLKEWTLMLFLAGDGTSPFGSVKFAEHFYYDLLNQLEFSLSGGFSNVNVIAFFDGGRIQVPGFPDGATLRGALQFDAGDTLKNFRVFPGTEVNTGDSAVLRAFVSWAMDTFPANRYALAVKSDGWGWKGILNDGGELGGSPSIIHWMEMKDFRNGLKAGLEGTKLDLLVLDAPFMGQMEVIAQMDSLTRFVTASPEMIEPADVDYALLSRKLENEPFLDSRDLAVFAVDSAVGRRVAGNPFVIWTAVDVDSLQHLLNSLDTLTGNLQNGIEDVCAIGTPGDNFQLKIREALVKTDHYGKQRNGMADFIDLKNFVDRLSVLPAPGCGNHLGGAASVATLLSEGGKVIPARLVGNRHSDAGGLSIYFPASREKNPSLPAARKDSMFYSTSGDYAYDFPRVQLQLQFIQMEYVYAADLNACYPHGILPSGVCAPSDSVLARQHPLPPTSGLLFSGEHQWDEFLLRYYKPVADAGGPDLSVLINQTTSFNGSGSSDADSDSLLYFWDVDSTADGSFECDSIFVEDMDKDCLDEKNDETNLKGKTPVYYGGFSQEREYLVTLHVWDSHDVNQPEGQRHFQTDASAIPVFAQQSIELVVEDNPYTSLYAASFSRIGKSFDRTLQLLATSQRTSLLPLDLRGYDPIIWETGDQSSTLFPSGSTDSTGTVGALGRVLNDTLTRQGIWIASRRLGQEFSGQQAAFFGGYFKLNAAGPGAVPCSILVTRDADSTFLLGLGPIRLKNGVMLESLKVVRACDYFPVLYCNNADSGKIVAAANIRELGSFDRGAFFSSFGLEDIRLDTPADSAVMDTLVRRVTDWLSHPTRSEIRAKGDMNDDCLITSTDVVQSINCTFLGIGSCGLSFADLNCDGILTSADVVLLTNYAFLGIAPPC